MMSISQAPQFAGVYRLSGGLRSKELDQVTDAIRQQAQAKNVAVAVHQESSPISLDEWEDSRYIVTGDDVTVWQLTDRQKTVMQDAVSIAKATAQAEAEHAFRRVLDAQFATINRLNIATPAETRAVQNRLGLEVQTSGFPLNPAQDATHLYCLSDHYAVRQSFQQGRQRANLLQAIQSDRFDVSSGKLDEQAWEPDPDAP